MVIDFSIEMSIGKIIDSRTRGYFEEVYRSYTAENYRSAVVMLWSVVICDLLFKLDHLANAYDDKTAREILKNTDRKRQKNPKSPEWEGDLLDEVSKKTQLLDPADFSSLQNLQSHRHLSAHPVISPGTDALYSPSKDVTRAHIRSALEAVLTKPAMMTKKILDTLLEDLEVLADLLPDQQSLKRYLEAKYFPHFMPAVEDAVFRSLWRITFKVSDERSEKNRSINYRTLSILYERRVVEINKAIESDKGYYSELHFSGSHIQYLISFLSEHPSVFNLLSEAGKTPIKTYVNSDLNIFAFAWFLSENSKEHFEKIFDKVVSGETLSVTTVGRLFDYFKQTQFLQNLIDIGIEIYGQSKSFADADQNFRIIRLLLDSFQKKDFLSLLDKIEQNNQTTGRFKANRDHSEIKSAIEKMFGAEFSFENYPSVF